MADQQQPEYLGLYVPEHGGEPVAIFRADVPGDHLALFRRALPDPTAAMIVPMKVPDFGCHADVAAQFAGPAPAPIAPGATNDPQALQRAAIRERLMRERDTQRLEAEIRAEMDAEARDTKRPERKA